MPYKHCSGSKIHIEILLLAGNEQMVPNSMIAFPSPISRPRIISKHQGCELSHEALNLSGNRLLAV